MKKVAIAIQNIFTRHCIIFSHVAKRELNAEFEALRTTNSPPGVEISELANKDSGSLRLKSLQIFPKRDMMQ